MPQGERLTAESHKNIMNTRTNTNQSWIRLLAHSHGKHCLERSWKNHRTLICMRSVLLVHLNASATTHPPPNTGPRDRVGQPSRAGKWGQIEGQNRGHRADPTRIHPRPPFQGQKLVLKTCPPRRPPTVGGRGAALKFRTGFRYPKQGPPRVPKCVFLHQPFSIS